MKVKTVTDRQIVERRRYEIHVQGWKLSKQYSTILYKNINKEVNFFELASKGFLPNQLYPLRSNIL